MVVMSEATNIDMNEKVSISENSKFLNETIIMLAVVGLNTHHSCFINCQLNINMSYTILMVKYYSSY